jgi:hypothetical protein
VAAGLLRPARLYEEQACSVARAVTFEQSSSHILAADVVGYSHLKGEDEAGTT